MKAKNVILDLNHIKGYRKAERAASYFKTGKSEYGYGDIFIGVTIPEQRKIAKKYMLLELDQVEILLKSPIHEHRMTGLLILTYKPLDKEIYDFYMLHIDHVNNWDLVDVTARDIVGHYLFDKEKKILHVLAQSKNLWERRIAIVATHYFVKQKYYAETLALAEKLLSDHHDLIHKAVGWMLREVGVQDKNVLLDFLYTHAARMPKTTLRYATEHFSKLERKDIVSK